MTFVDRLTRCIVAWDVVWERTPERTQQMLDLSVKARQYYSDQFPTYTQLIYWPGQTHQALPDKSQTYSVEGVNADLRHYLARLRRRSRCFSRCLYALQRAIKLFVYTYNQRQLYKWRYPAYQAFPMDFVSPGL